MNIVVDNKIVLAPQDCQQHLGVRNFTLIEKPSGIPLLGKKV